MFVGHYAAALAAKAAEPRAPLWTYAVAAQFVDIGWAALIMTGAEKVRIDASLPGSTLDLYSMPYTHSLPGAAAWSVMGVFLALLVLRLPWRAGVFVGLTVFSHWILDFLVHRPDLELWHGGPKVGLALWNYPVPEQAIEMGLLAVAGAFLAGQRARQGRSVWPVGLLLAILTAVQIVAMFAPPSGGPVQMGLMALAAYLAIAAVAWAVDRGPVDAAARLRRPPSRA